MAFPVGWGRKCALTIQATEVDADLTDWTYLLTEDSLPSEMFDEDGANHALDGGGDIRFSSDSEGATQLPCDVRAFVTDNDPTLGKASIAVKVPLVSSSVNTTIYIWYGKSGETQPAASSTYGQYNAYDANLTVWDGRSVNTRTTPVRELTVVGGASLNDVNDSRPYFGFDGADDGMSEPAWITGTPLVLHGLAYMPTGAAEGVPIWNGDSGLGAVTANFVVMQPGAVVSAGCAVIVYDTREFATSSPYTISADEWTYFAARFVSATSRFAYLNGDVGTEITTSCNPTGIDLFHLGGSRSGFGGVIGADFNGRLSEVRVSSVDRSSEWLNAEYSNLLTPEAFTSVGTPASARPSIYHAILEKVQSDLRSLDLAEIADDNIQVIKVLNERETIMPGLPGILIHPVGQELMPSQFGTVGFDYIGYPVAVVMLDIDRQDTGSGIPEDAVTGTQDQDFRLDSKLTWRDRIRKKFHHQRLSIDISGADIYTCQMEPNPVVQANTWLETNLWVSAVVLRFFSREKHR